MDYAAEDFLLFSAETYWRLFERVNADTAPLWALAVLAGLAVCGAMTRQGLMRPALALLATGWLIAGLVFLENYYVPIHWALWPAPWAFAAMAAVLASLAVRRVGWRRSPAGLALGLYAVALHPLSAVLYDRPLAGAEIGLIAPDPTAMLTLALVSALHRPALRVAVSVPPILWLTQSALTLHVMDTPERWTVTLVLLAAPFLLLRQRRA